MAPYRIARLSRSQRRRKERIDVLPVIFKLQHQWARK
jgi:hypothetical protein